MKYLLHRGYSPSVWMVVWFWAVVGNPLLMAQSEQVDTLVSFDLTTVVERTYHVELVRYDSLALKKTVFDTTQYSLLYAEECLLCEISATNPQVLGYCSIPRETNKKSGHYESIASMSADALYFVPTLKFVQYGANDTTAFIKLFIVDNVKHRKIRSLRRIDKEAGCWKLSANQIDGEIGMMISSLRDDVLADIMLRRLDHTSDLYELQEQSFPDGVLNLRAMAKGYSQWFVKGKERTELIQKYTEKLIQ